MAGQVSEQRIHLEMWTMIVVHIFPNMNPFTTYFILMSDASQNLMPNLLDLLCIYYVKQHLAFVGNISSSTVTFCPVL